MLINTGIGPDLEAARVGFHAAFFEQFGVRDDEPLARLYAEVRSTTAVEEHRWITDIEGMSEWKGDRKLGMFGWANLRIRNKDWSGGIRVHQNELADDNTGMVSISLQQLARAARRHKIDLLVQHLINGFNGGAYPEVGNGLGYDGAFFFSADHATGSNRLAVTLSNTAVETAELLLQSQTNPNGDQPLDLRGDTLIVGPKWQFEAQRIATGEYLADGTTLNALRGRYTVMVSPRLTGAYDDYWFLADLSAPIRPFLFQMREDISTSAITGDKGGTNDSLPRFQRGELWFGVEARYNVGYFEHRTIVGSIV